MVSGYWLRLAVLFRPVLLSLSPSSGFIFSCDLCVVRLELHGKMSEIMQRQPLRIGRGQFPDEPLPLVGSAGVRGGSFGATTLRASGSLVRPPSLFQVRAPQWMKSRRTDA